MTTGGQPDSRGSAGLFSTALSGEVAGAQAVIDSTNTRERVERQTVAFFRDATRNLLAAEQRAGVGHHVVLSIVGIHKALGNPHYAGKRAQEEAVAQGSVPWTIVAATQFFDFPLMVASWTRDGDTVTLPPLLMRVPTVLTVHDLTVQLFPESHSARRRLRHRWPASAPGSAFAEARPAHAGP